MPFQNFTGAIKLTRIFQDDPDAIPRLEQKIANQEKEKLEIKARDHKGWELSNLGALIRTNKKTLEKLKARKNQGITLERKPTFNHGGKKFYYVEVKNEADKNE